MSADTRQDTPPRGVKYQETAQHAQHGYETLDAQAGATYRAGLYILGTMFLVAAMLVPMYWFLVRSEARGQAPAATVIRERPAAAVAAFPKLVTSEPAVLADFRRQEDELLDGYGWVEKDRGIARMPIADAVRIVGERGALPTFQAPAPPQAPAAGAAPTRAGSGGAR